MLMHADKSGNDCLPCQVQNLCSRRIRILKFRALNTDNFSTLDVDPLILGWHSARTIYDADVVEYQDRRIFADIRFDCGRRLSKQAVGCHHESRGNEDAHKWHGAIPQVLWPRLW